MKYSIDTAPLEQLRQVNNSSSNCVVFYNIAAGELWGVCDRVFTASRGSPCQE